MLPPHRLVRATLLAALLAGLAAMLASCVSAGSPATSSILTAFDDGPWSREVFRYVDTTVLHYRCDRDRCRAREEVTLINTPSRPWLCQRVRSAPETAGQEILNLDVAGGIVATLAPAPERYGKPFWRPVLLLTLRGRDPSADGPAYLSALLACSDIRYVAGVARAETQQAADRLADRAYLEAARRAF